MSRKAKQADLRRRMAEARSKLLQSQYPLPNDEEGNDEEEVGGKIIAVLGTMKRPLSPTGGILKKSKYTSKPINSHNVDVGVTQQNSSHQASLGALMDGYGSSSSSDDDEDDDGNRNEKNSAIPSSATVTTISTDPPPSQTTKEDEGKQMSKSSSIESSKPAAAKEDATVPDEVWDEFNAMLEADEAANKSVIDTTTTTSTKRDDETLLGTHHHDANETTTTSPTTPQETDATLNNDNEKSNKEDDLYDNEDNTKPCDTQRQIQSNSNTMYS